MKYLRDIKELEGVKVLMRVDFNIPVTEGKVTDDFRIRKVIPTISYLLEKKARVILVSHIETNKKSTDKSSIEPVAQALIEGGVKCVFVKKYRDAILAIENMKPDQVILLENLRMNEGEEKNDKKFAQELASLADIYVNEAFAVSHRAHASVAAITEYLPSYAGLLFEREVTHLSSAFNPEHPFLFILGGAKFETKLPLIEKFFNIADKVFVGGALANNFLKEQGKDVGNSLVSPENFNLARFFNSPRLLLPTDHAIKDGAIFDVGPETVSMLEKEVLSAKYVLWNGPLGAYEMGYKQPTLDVAAMLVRATENGTKTILGGADTLATIAELGTEDKYTFVSTGGGAMLEFLAQGTLPGIKALEESHA